ncbi:MbtH family protein [Allokutzneria albata]|uniref:MbtH protein n=1 Tax=Allokutzneria albata TaxID=211114 RepID=A0A1G9UBU1_ALLAB|nr:MbtH family protein [Allokutzneria albata]SDM57406.1 MbtH protein [Allokutzneria albata]
MTNPFDDPVGSYSVLINDEGQHSLWRDGVDVPRGWRVVHGGASRESCLRYVDENWTDLRPAGLAARMDNR